jgi:HK97 family phage major capsid protein
MAAAASASQSVACGDSSAYHELSLPVRIEISRDYKFGSDQQALRTARRVDGRLVDTAAVKYLVSAAT